MIYARKISGKLTPTPEIALRNPNGMFKTPFADEQRDRDHR